MNPHTIKAQLTKLTTLKPHEEVDPKHLQKLKSKIESDGILKLAIVADKNTNVILDGEHRYTALKELGCKTIPVVFVDYNSPQIEVQSWKGNPHLTKKDVIEAGLSGRKLPPKTSKHMVKFDTQLAHISIIQKRVDAPLDILKGEVKLLDIKAVKPIPQTNLKVTLAAYAKLTKTGIVEDPIIIDEEINGILAGHEIYQALDLLQAKKIPALRISQKQRQNIAKIKNLKINVALEELLAAEEENKRLLKVYGSTLELLHENWPTPLVKLNSLSTEKRSVWAKLEGYNPFSNSVKDRIGWAMINEALARKELKEILYEATSTNTGIALTSIANILGFKTKLYIPMTVQKVSDIYLKVLGSEVVRLPVGLTVEAISKVDSEAKLDGAAHLNQFENDANFKVHLKYTASEIDAQIRSQGLKPTCIIGGLGTSGHMSAISFYFKNKYKNNVKIIGVQPAPNEVIPGIRRIETGMKWYHWTKFDSIVEVKQAEAIEGAIQIARKEGILIGLSAGAVVHAFHQIAKAKGVYILIFPDTGFKYAEQFQKYFETNPTTISG